MHWIKWSWVKRLLIFSVIIYLLCLFLDQGVWGSMFWLLGALLLAAIWIIPRKPDWLYGSMKKEMDEYEAQLDKQPNDPVLFTLYGGSYGDHHDLSQEVKLLISKIWIKRPEGRPVSAKDGIQSTGFALKIHSYTVSSRTTYTKTANMGKSAALGGILAGPAGAIVGAAMAADKNAHGGVQKTAYGGSERFYYITCRGIKITYFLYKGKTYRTYSLKTKKDAEELIQFIDKTLKGQPVMPPPERRKIWE